MPRPGAMRVQEKSKDFKKSFLRLLKNLKPWKYLMLMSLFLALVSSLLTLLCPNKLSELTDSISKGIYPSESRLELVMQQASQNLKSGNIINKMQELLINSSLSETETTQIKAVLDKIQSSSNPNEFQMDILNLPDSVLIQLFEEIKIDDITISVIDQLSMIKLFASNENNDVLAKFNQLPDSIKTVIIPEVDMNKVKSISLIVGTILIFGAISGFIQGYSLTTVSNRFANKLRDSICKKINRLPLKYFDIHETGDVLSRVTNDVDTVSHNLNNSLSTLVSSITLFLGSILMMFATDWIMALTAILSSVLGFVVMFAILGKSQKYFNARQAELGNMNGYIEEMYSGHNVVKAYNGTKDAIEKFAELNDKLYVANQKSQFLSGLMHPIMGFVGNLGYVAVCIVGALLTMNNIITFGVIVAFMLYVRLFTNNLSQIAQAMGNLQFTVAAAERVFEFLDEKEMSLQDDTKKHLSKSKVKGEIEFQNVRFGYDAGKTIINDFSIKVNPGQKVAIVGPTGAGKTTLVNLLMKFYDINHGQILIDGVSTSELTRENIHELFIMVLQDTWLFEGTIAENIRFNKDDVSDREIWKALKTVGVHHFVKTLPEGINYQIGDNDAISQGQKQLLTIARGMIEDAPFLILDEATSNVDTRTEELVQKAMDKLTEGRTSFIIAHRLSTIKNADLILVMNEGNIIEQGTHDELIKKGGFYENLYNSQFEKIV